MGVLKDCKDHCFNDIDKAIDYIKSHKYCIHIILYHYNENILYHMIDSLYNDIKEHNKGLCLDEQIRPTYPYYFRDIDGCLGVQCAEISMNFYEGTTHLTPLFYGGYKNDVLDLQDKEML